MGTHEAVSTGGSPWRILVDGVVQDGTHSDQHKALARAFRLAYEHPGADVRIRREAEVRLELDLPADGGDDVVPLPQPMGYSVVELDRTDDSVTFEATWEAVEGAVGYQQRSYPKGADPRPPWSATFEALQTAELLERGETDEAIRICVRAVDADGNPGMAACVEVTVPAAPVEPEPSEHPNEPAGMTPVTDRPFDALDDDGWGYNENPGYSIVEVDDAPHSPPNVGEMFYPAGFESGSSPSRTWRGLGEGDWRRLYLDFWHRVSPNWYGHASNVNKILFLTRRQSAGAPAIVNYTGAGDGPFYPQIRMQDNHWGSYKWDQAVHPDIPNESGVTEQEARLVPGKWQRWEIDLIYNTAGEADGTIRLWIDGKLILDYPGVAQFTRDVDPALMFWSGVKWDPTHGGTEGEVPEDQFQQIDNLYASVGEGP